MQASLLPTHPPSLVGAGARTPSSPLPGEPLPASWGLWLRWQLSHPPQPSRRGSKASEPSGPEFRFCTHSTPCLYLGDGKRLRWKEAETPNPELGP